VPAYLTAVTVLEPRGNVAAAVVDAVYRLSLRRRRRRLPIVIGVIAVTLIGVVAGSSWIHRVPSVITGKDGSPALLIPGGTFTFGDDKESPLRTVYVDAFYLDRFEVTVGRFAGFLEATGSVRPPDRWQEVDVKRDGDLPVIGVNWHDAVQYCRWAGKRLPTEAEWEKAARSADARAYPWGNKAPTPEHAQFGKQAASPYLGGLARVGVHPAGKSANGVDDLAGNASEWVADFYSEIFNPDDVRNPRGPNAGAGKVIRGGGWDETAERLKATKRFFANPDTRADDIGFRCASDRRS